jgi:hypothetical protein
LDGRHSKERQEERRWLRRQLKVTETSDGRMVSGTPLPTHLAARVVTVEANHRVAVPPDGMSRDEWMRELQAALGGGSEAFVSTLLNQLIDAAAINRDHVTTTESLSGALELLRGLAPTNTAEAALAIHVTMLHMAAAAMNGRIALYGSTRTTVEHAVAAAKLERAFLAACHCYHRIRFGHRQVIRIERVIEVARPADELAGDPSPLEVEDD